MDEQKKYKAIIVGAGPAGIFCALKLTEKDFFSSKDILLLEKGKPLNQRKCWQKKLGCLNCSPCNVVSGWGGAGAFSDGKLNFTFKSGGWLGEYLDRTSRKNFLKEAEKYWHRFGNYHKTYGINQKAVERIRKKCQKAGLKLINFPIKHLGSDGGRETLSKIYSFLKNKIEIRFNTQVQDLIVEKQKVKGVVLSNGKKIFCQYLFIAPGRGGADWFLSLAAKYKLKTLINPVDLGVRVEIDNKIYEPLAKFLYETKIHYQTPTFKDEVRTFCVCPQGEVAMESLGGDFPVKTVNGYSLANRKTKNTNFALLVSSQFTTPFEDPIFYAKSIAKMANLLSGGIIVQRLKDLWLGQRSTFQRIKNNKVKPTLKTAVPGDLAFVLPYRYLVDILETLRALEKIMPGLWDSHTLLYGVEIKLYSSRIKVNKSLETEIKNLFVGGDGAGLTRGLVQASISGLVAGQKIIELEKRKVI